MLACPEQAKRAEGTNGDSPYDLSSCNILGLFFREGGRMEQRHFVNRNAGCGI
jgi:hypothetical protein